MLDLSFLRVYIAVTTLKLLLVPAYRSTDFEVHRNWLAITHSLPLREWYIEATSEWTLDYPPLFAWFEWFLSKFAVFFDPQMLMVENLNYASNMTILFQRLTVIVSDGVLISAVWKACSKSRLDIKSQLFLFGLVVGNIGLLIVDHIHFQYNGLLIGLPYPFNVASKIESNRGFNAAVIFSILLNMKHLFIYSAPVFFAYLLKHDCVDSKNNKLLDFVKLGLVVLFVCGISLGPFIIYGQLQQLFARLFPFGRGLCHTYWAPNVWALYTFADKALSYLFHVLKVKEKSIHAHFTGGQIGQWSFEILPNITPKISLIFVFLFTLLPAVFLFRNPSSAYFMECVAYANFCGFIWGYHVHEKAILTVLIPTILVVFRPNHSRFKQNPHHFLTFSTIAHYSLMPLLYKPEEYPIKLLLLFGYAILLKQNPSPIHETIPSRFQWLYRIQNSVYKCLPLVEFVHWMTFFTRLKFNFPFLPLMISSVFCSIGLCVHWLMWTLQFMEACFKKDKIQ